MDMNEYIKEYTGALGALSSLETFDERVDYLTGRLGRRQALDILHVRFCPITEHWEGKYNCIDLCDGRCWK